jgi:hypothetical protein
MTVGLVYMYGTGILTYRLLRHEKKKILKLIHAIGKGYMVLDLCPYFGLLDTVR